MEQVIFKTWRRDFKLQLNSLRYKNSVSHSIYRKLSQLLTCHIKIISLPPMIICTYYIFISTSMTSQLLFHELEVILQWKFVVLTLYRQLENHTFSAIRDCLLNIGLYESRLHHHRTCLELVTRIPRNITSLTTIKTNHTYRKCYGSKIIQEESAITGEKIP